MKLTQNLVSRLFWSFNRLRIRPIAPIVTKALHVKLFGPMLRAPLNGVQPEQAFSFVNIRRAKDNGHRHLFEFALQEKLVVNRALLYCECALSIYNTYSYAT